MCCGGMNKHERMLLALLCGALHGRQPEREPFGNATEEDWRQCYRLAATQGVRALAWDGIMLLPAELWPPRRVKLTWATDVERYEQRYRHYVTAADELSRFYAQHGIRMMQLKGVGLSHVYPVPSHREGGDIDIYTWSADRDRMSDSEANSFADELMRRQGIVVERTTRKHSEFFYKGIPVENHKTFVDVERGRRAVTVERILHGRMHPQPTVLDGGEVLTPAPDFNTLFVAYHAMIHYGGGMKLHHLCDWACLCMRYGQRMPTDVTDRHFLHFVSALTQLSNRLLGTDIPDDTAAPEALAQEVLMEMLRPPFANKVPTTNPVGIIIYKIRRFAHRQRVRRRVVGELVYREILRSIINHLRTPKLIFRRGT